MALSSENLLAAVKESAAANSAKSQSFAREQMKFNAEQAAISRAWQAEMANTAHQREVKDLIAAGLNPILSSGGNGAAVPSGATAVGAQGNVDNSYSNALASYATTLISSAANIEMAKLSASATLGAAATSAAASRYGSDVSAAASRYGASTSAAASRYGADRSMQSTLGAAGMNLISNITGQNISSSATRYSADQHKSASIWSSAISSAGNVISSLINANSKPYWKR